MDYSSTSHGHKSVNGNFEAEKSQYRKNKKKKPILKKIIKSWQLYILLLLPVIYIIVFAYAPMIGAQIAFRDFMPREGISGSAFVGFKYFKQFINSVRFIPLILNTIVLSMYNLCVGLPFAVIFALSLNYIRNAKFKKTIQMVSYAPNFISTVVMCGIIIQFLNPRIGVVNNIAAFIGFNRVNFMAESSLFSSIYVWTNLWQTIGFNSIIFVAVLSSVSPELHEAAVIDGANIIKRMINIDLPSLMPIAVTLLILNVGQILNVGFEKVLLLQTPLNLQTSEIIATYVYKVGLTSNLPNYSYATAVGLFQSFVGLIVLVLVNYLSKKFSDTSLW